jgi:hypothetical protein
MVMSCLSPRRTAFGDKATTKAHHGAAESLPGNGGGRIRTANACSHCGGRFGMVTHRCWGSKFCKKTCKASFLRELDGKNEICRCFGFIRRALALGFWSPFPSRVMASAQP